MCYMIFSQILNSTSLEKQANNMLSFSVKSQEVNINHNPPLSYQKSHLSQ